MKRLKSIKAALLIIAASASVSSAHVVASECDDVLNGGHSKIPGNSTVDIIVDPNSLVGVNGNDIVSGAAGTLRGRVDGINFNVTSVEGSRPSIVVKFVNGANGDRTALYKSGPKVDGTLNTGEIYVYLGATGCVADATRPCFDPSQPGYQNALFRSMVHELIHSLGALDSNQANIMSAFTGVNSSQTATGSTIGIVG